MYSAYDQASNFYYYGETEPSATIYKDLLTSPAIISADVETISLKEQVPLGIGVAVDPSHSFYFPLFPNPSPVTPWHLLRNPEVKKVFHNAIFDLYCMRAWGLDMTNIADTAAMSRLLCYRWNDLTSLQ